MKFAVCNSGLRRLSAPQAFDCIAQAGFDGVEIAPRTIGPSLLELAPSDVSTARKALEASGLDVVGVHTIFGRDPQFHILSDDPNIREHTLNAILQAVRLCGELGGHNLTSGSP